jgi:hypothetical protein
LAVEAAARASTFTAALSGVFLKGLFTKKLLQLFVGLAGELVVCLAAVQEFHGVKNYSCHLS